MVYFAGTPFTFELSGTFFVTTEPAPTITQHPIIVSGRIVAFAPIYDECPTFILPRVTAFGATVTKSEMTLSCITLALVLSFT